MSNLPVIQISNDPATSYQTLIEKVRIMAFISFTQNVDRIKSLVKEKKISVEEGYKQLKIAEITYESHVNESR